MARPSLGSVLRLLPPSKINALVYLTIAAAALFLFRPQASALFWVHIYPTYQNLIMHRAAFVGIRKQCHQCQPIEVEMRNIVLDPIDVRAFERCFMANLESLRLCLPPTDGVRGLQSTKWIQVDDFDHDLLCSQDEASPRADSFILRAARRDAEHSSPHDQPVVVMLHGRNSSPWEMAGYCAGDYTNQSMQVWSGLNFDVHAIKISGREGNNETERFIRDLLAVISYIDFLVDQGKSIILYGISYGDVIANSVARAGRYDEIVAYVSVGGIWRSDFNSADDENSKQSDLYFSEAGMLSNTLNQIISLSSYDWGRASEETKSRILAAADRSNFRLHLFRGMHESDPVNELILLQDLLNAR